ncbi:MAG: beta-galactosidase [Candidatus Sumerlaeota bacterium]|nr:beta-galactosidase [Candidatus Sumerlaeota bacterium]
MMITWRAFSAEDMAAYRRNGLDTVFKILGATDWSFVESKRGECDFSRLRSSLQLAKDAGLHAIPTISFDNPPPWFTDTYPDSVPRYSDGSAPKSGKISLAWLIEKHRAKYERHEEAPDYEALESYIKATLTELQRWDNVIGVEIPWRTFAGAFFYKPGAKEEKKSQTLEKYPQLAILGGFDPWFKARWQRPEPIPATWEEYKKQSADLQEYWQNWGEQANGEAAKILLTLAHRNAPNYLIVLRKHIWVRTTDPAWMSPDLATVMQLNERQFRVFLDHVKAFSDETGWKGVMFDNDAFFDKSKANNSLATRDLVAKSGFLYMGEGNTSEEDTWQSGAIANIKAVRPDAFAFIPAPGRRGGNIANEKEQIIIRLMREPAKKQDARTP